MGVCDGDDVGCREIGEEGVKWAPPLQAGVLRRLKNRWSARVEDKAPSPRRRSRGAQLNR